MLNAMLSIHLGLIILYHLHAVIHTIIYNAPLYKLFLHKSRNYAGLLLTVVRKSLMAINQGKHIKHHSHIMQTLLKVYLGFCGNNERRVQRR